MKKSSIFIPLLVLIVVASALFLLLTSSNSIDNRDSINNQEQDRPLVLSMTASVEIPDSMVFAGEKIVFDRYDKRERMDRELNSFTYFHSTTMLLFKRANRILPLVEPILEREGVPDDLKYLMIIESSLDPRAVSPASAAGLWQFLRTTGREHGLEVNDNIDERYHVEKSTVAATKYLKAAYRKYGSWSAAAMSYNGGQGRITRELSNQRADEALDLWLVEETTRYYYRMLAIKQVFENPQQYGFIIKAEHLYKPMEFKRVQVTKTIPDLVSFAEQHGVTYAQLKDFNSWLRDRGLNNASGRTYTILIPTQEDLYYRKGEEPKVHNRAWVVD